MRWRRVVGGGDVAFHGGQNIAPVGAVGLHDQRVVGEVQHAGHLKRLRDQRARTARGECGASSGGDGEGGQMLGGAQDDPPRRANVERYIAGQIAGVLVQGVRAGGDANGVVAAVGVVAEGQGGG